MSNQNRRALLTFAAAPGATIPFLASTETADAADGLGMAGSGWGDPRALRIAQAF
jgi:hypothetical protein